MEDFLLSKCIGKGNSQTESPRHEMETDEMENRDGDRMEKTEVETETARGGIRMRLPMQKIFGAQL